MGRKKRHHYVPRGQQRWFAEDDRIRLIACDGSLDRIVGTRDAFVRSDVNTFLEGRHRNSELEEAWARRESDALPAIRDVIRGDRSPRAVLEIKVLMAMQFARSRWHQESFRRIALQTVPGFRREMERSTHVRRQFRRELGRRPRPGEIGHLVDDLMAEHLRTREQHILGMARHFNLCLERFEEFQLQVVHTLEGPAEFITSDTPVISASGDLDGEVLTGRAIGDASLLMMPLTRRHYVALSASPVPDPQFIPSHTVRRLNETAIQNAQVFVAAHPAADLAACGVGLGRP